MTRVFVDLDNRRRVPLARVLPREAPRQYAAELQSDGRIVLTPIGEAVPNLPPAEQPDIESAILAAAGDPSGVVMSVLLDELRQRFQPFFVLRAATELTVQGRVEPFEDATGRVCLRLRQSEQGGGR